MILNKLFLASTLLVTSTLSLASEKEEVEKLLDSVPDIKATYIQEAKEAGVKDVYSLLKAWNTYHESSVNNRALDSSDIFDYSIYWEVVAAVEAGHEITVEQRKKLIEAAKQVDLEAAQLFGLSDVSELHSFIDYVTKIEKKTKIARANSIGESSNYLEVTARGIERVRVNCGIRCQNLQGSSSITESVGIKWAMREIEDQLGTYDEFYVDYVGDAGQVYKVQVWQRIGNIGVKKIGNDLCTGVCDEWRE